MLTKRNTDQFINLYTICFIANFLWLLLNGLTFSTFNPVFFLNALDFSTNFLLLTNIQHLIISSKFCRILLDIFFLTLPLLLLYTHYYKPKYRPTIALVNTIFNLLYCILLSIFTFITTQQCIPWVLIPLVFCCISIEKFSVHFYALRWIFLAIFLSAGLWKLKTGAIFNTEQMSALLLQQYAQNIIDGKINNILSYFILNNKIAHVFYIGAFIAEVSFVVGFFTTKYDRYLIIIFCLFIVLDYFMMEINYFSWIVFIGFLYFTKYNSAKTIVQT